jgi:hypothetical protein
LAAMRKAFQGPLDLSWDAPTHSLQGKSLFSGWSKAKAIMYQNFENAKKRVCCERGEMKDSRDERA